MKSLSFAFMFFTRIPLGKSIDWDAQTAARSLSFLPLTGLALGLLLSALYKGMIYLGWPHIVYLQMAILLLVEVWFGGFLLVDGFADSCDGLFSQTDKEKMLVIMKDSRLGTLGVLGLILFYFIKLFLLVELAAWPQAWRVFIFYPSWGRWCVSSSVHFFKTAKNQGLAAFFKENQTWTSWFLATSITLVCSLILGPVWLSLPLSALIVFLTACWIQGKLGGQTGDTYGFLNCIGELSLLLIISFLFK